MTKEHSPDRLDVKAFAQARGRLSGHDSLLKYKRLAEMAQHLHPDLYVDWSADGELRDGLDGGPQPWLHLKAQATFPVVCQRCLQPMDVPLQVDRSFRFVQDEAAAEALDGESEEDLLALSREFRLRELVEDELLMALPLVPRHAHCPQPVKMSVGEEELKEAEVPVNNPFAALAGLPPHKPKH